MSTFDAGLTFDQGATFDDDLSPAVYPVPPGRGRWRLTLHWKRLAPGQTATTTMITELRGARSRTVTRTLNKPSTLTFTISGRTSAASRIEELAQEVWAWRWSYVLGVDVPMFAGVITDAEDQLTEQDHTINVTCQDVSAQLSARQLVTQQADGQAYDVLNADQDKIISDLILAAGGRSDQTTATGALLAAHPGLYLPLIAARRNSDSTRRTTMSSQLRQRTFPVGQVVFDALDGLCNDSISGGFDWDVVPNPSDTSTDLYRIFYPTAGIFRSDKPLVYGWNLATVPSRTITSSDFGNWQVGIGAAPSVDSTATPSPATVPPFYSATDPSMDSVLAGSPGIWMRTSSFSSVSDMPTLVENTTGQLATNGVIVPSYTAGLRSGAWDRLSPQSDTDPARSWPGIHMGDTVPLIIRSGRLDVEDAIRVVGIVYSVSDDGAAESVQITFGRPDTTLADYFTGAERRLATLERR